MSSETNANLIGQSSKDGQAAGFHPPLRAELAQFLDTLGDPFYVLDKDWRFIYVNERTQTVWDKSADALIGQNVWEVFPALVDTRLYHELHQAVNDQQPRSFETQGVYIGGWYEVHVHPNKLGLAVTFHKITDRIEAQRSIREREELLNLVVSAAKLATYEYDPVRDVHHSDSSVKELIGHDRDVSLGEYLSWIHPDDRVRVTSQIHDSLNPKGSGWFNAEYRLMLPNGDIRWIAARSQTSFGDHEGKRQAVRVFGTLQDITLRKQAEETLRESLRELRRLTETIPQKVWISDAEGYNNYFNQQWLNYTGMTYEEAVGFGWRRAVHPDDLPVLSDAWTVAQTQQEGIQAFARLRRYDGIYRWMLVRMTPYRDEQGRIIKWYGTTTDIDQLMQAQLALTASEERFAKAFRASPQALSISRQSDGLLIEVNESYEKLMSYPREDVLGRTSLVMNMIVDPERRAEGIRLLREQGRLQGFEMDIRTRSGEIRRVSLSVEAITIKNEACMLTIIEDITDQQKAQARAAHLQQVTTALSQAPTAEEVAQVTLDYGFTALGASAGSVVQVSDDGAELELIDLFGYSAEIERAWLRFLLTPDTPLGAAVLSQKAVFLESRSEFTQQYPRLGRPRMDNHHAWVSLPLVVNDRSIGGIGLAFEQPQTFSDDDRNYMLVLASQSAQALERARLYDTTRRLLLGSEAANQRLRRIQQVTEALGKVLTFEKLGEVIIAQALDVLGAISGTFQLLVENGTVFEIVHRVGPQETEGTFRKWQRYPALPDYPATDAVRRKENLWFESGEEVGQRYPAVAAVAAHNPGAAVMLPILLDDQALGLISLIFKEKRVISPEERSFMLALVQQCAQALERARLYEAEQQQRLQVSRLQQMTAALGSALTMREVGEVITYQIITVLDAIMGTFHLVKEGGTKLDYLFVLRDQPREQVEWRTSDVRPGFPATEVVREKQPLWFESGEEVIQRYPPMAAGVLPDTGASAVLPLMPTGELLGIVSLIFRQRGPFSEENRKFMLALAEQCGQALERARLYEAELVSRERAERSLERQKQLQRVTAALSGALSLKDVAKAVIQEGVVPIGANRASVLLLTPDNMFEIIEALGMPDTYNEGWMCFPADPALPATDVTRLGEPLWLETTTQRLERYPATEVFNDYYNGAWAFLPLVMKNQTTGVLCLNFPQEQTFDDNEREHLVALARQCGQAMERAQLYEDERRSREEAEKANALKLKFLAIISHELRTPLASIKGFSSSMLATDVSFDGDQQRMFMRVIDTEADKLNGLIEELLDLSRLEAGTLSISPMPQPFDAVLGSIYFQLEHLTTSHTLVLNVPQNLPYVMVDSMRIGQVVLNLVENAVKFGPPGTTVQLEAREKDTMLEVRVFDQGPGIPEEAQGYIFEAFRQVERKNRPHQKGAGLGLAICKGLVEAHGGRIWIESSSSEGATIAFTVPFVQQA
ncbi:MAG: GAF domain-containing protein [bacterium]|nr:GAF domain-containing protein [bacterium]